MGFFFEHMSVEITQTYGQQVFIPLLSSRSYFDQHATLALWAVALSGIYFNLEVGRVGKERRY